MRIVHNLCHLILSCLLLWLTVLGFMPPLHLCEIGLCWIEDTPLGCYPHCCVCVCYVQHMCWAETWHRVIERPLHSACPWPQPESCQRRETKHFSRSAPKKIWAAISHHGPTFHLRRITKCHALACWLRFVRDSESQGCEGAKGSCS